MKKILTLFILFLIATAPKISFGEDIKEPVITDINKIPPILDPEYRHRKKNQFEMSVYGGSYLGDTIGQTFLVGVRPYYHFNNTWAVGAAYGFSRLNHDPSSTFGQNLNSQNMHILDAELAISNDAAFRVGKSLVEMDFYLTLGAGAMMIDKVWEPAGLFGGGVKFYPGISWLAFRIDVSNYIHKVNFSGKSAPDFDVVFLGGISFLFPTNPSPYEKH